MMLCCCSTIKLLVIWKSPDKGLTFNYAQLLAKNNLLNIKSTTLTPYFHTFTFTMLFQKWILLPAQAHYLDTWWRKCQQILKCFLCWDRRFWMGHIFKLDLHYYFNLEVVRTTLQYMMNSKLSQHRFWTCHENGRLIRTIQTAPQKNLCEFQVSISLLWIRTNQDKS